MRRSILAVLLLSGACIGTRDVAAAPYNLGVNLDFNTDWATARTWVDVRHIFRTWGQVGQPWVAKSGLTLTAEGYPLQDAEALAGLPGYPAGVYKLSYQGTGTVTFPVGGTVSNKVTSGGVTTADVAYPGSGNLQIRITGVSQSDPVRNLKLIAPGYPADGSVKFTNEFLKRLRPFKTLRYMDWGKTNHSPIREWSDRIRATGFVQTSDDKGVCYEDMIALSNATGKNMWICVPDRASDDFVRNLATLIRDNVNPNLTVYVEYSNEIWNTAFTQYGRILADGRANPVLTRSDDWGRCAEQAAFRLKAISDIFKTTFGTRAGQVKPVLGGYYEAGAKYFLECGLSFLQSRYGNVSNIIGGIAIAPYVGHTLNGSNYGGSLNTLFTKLNSDVDTMIIPGIQAHKALATQYGVPLFSYEGGQHLAGFDENVMKQANRDPRMGVLMKRLLDVWSANGGSMFCYFNFCGSWGIYGCWGLLEDNFNSTRGSAKWDYVVGCACEAGDVNLDGVVDYQDFLAFAANYGQSGKFWEDGDFNHDGKVDAEDLAALRTSITGLTAAQLAEITAFAGGAALPPTVGITSPNTGGSFLAGSSITISAAAGGGTGGIAKIEFYQGTTKLGEDMAAPHSCTWAGVKAGTYNLTAKVFDAAGASVVSPAVSITVAADSGTTPTPPSTGSGDGLKGEYYDNPDLTSLKATKVDPAVNFEWGGAAPDPALTGDTFAVRWTGQVQPRHTETYTFFTSTDDGVRLWVNGKLLIDKWIDQGKVEYAGTIALTAGQKYDIKMEYYNGYGWSAAYLMWSSPSQVKEVVPQSALYSAAGGGTTPTPAAGTKYEAESTANLFYKVTTKTNAAASAGKVIGSIGLGKYVTFRNINVPKAGNYTVTICYLTAAVKTCYISKNGGAGTPFNFPTTGGSTTLGSKTITLSLKAGVNTLRFFNSAAAAPDIDCITITPVTP